MKLQADPTIIYGLLPNFDGDIKKSDILDSNNKYNTYMIKGLPPTPIALVSLSSLDAAANATLGEYLYFVADSPSSHYFSKTYPRRKNMNRKKREKRKEEVFLLSDLIPQDAWDHKFINTNLRQGYFLVSEIEKKN